MTYRFATRDESYEDFASGRVLRGAPMHTAFPVRLGREMFEQCRALQAPGDAHRRCVLHDPCCGGGFLATVVGLLYGEQISAVAASDVSAEAVSLARRNLSLLTREGLDARTREIRGDLAAFGKPAHAAAIESAGVLGRLLAASPPDVRCFAADARDAGALRDGLGGLRPDVVISDVPYGRAAAWQDANGSPVDPRTAIHQMLGALLAVTADGCVVALATDHHQKVEHPAYVRRRQFKIGKRRITWLVRA